MAKKTKRKRKGRGAGKGSSFERKMCVLLSKWWTDGKRDDVFWRSSGSGNRATLRHKFRHRSKGATYGSHGDVSAIDPIGTSLLDVFTISLKNGYHECHASGLLDKPNPKVLYELEKWIVDACAKWQASGSLTWMIIHQRTSRAKVVYMPSKAIGFLGIDFFPRITLFAGETYFHVVPFADWLRRVTPQLITSISERN